MILASGSPRRKQILTLMGFDFDVIVPDGIDEKSYLNIDNLNESLCNLAQRKAMSVAKSFPSALVLGADTIVVKDSHVLGKPENKQDAFRMLQTLSGAMHTVTTGIALVCNECGFVGTKAINTKVYFRAIPDEEIGIYLDVNPDYMDKAGAYAIQGKALIFIEKIEGCYYNVVGLPVIGTIDLFKDFTVRKESADV
ncbi:MAG: septum formation protein Maf [Fibrobacter sp.]|nr:septum formation protein Maf [Fibrobacter sp.]